MDDKNLPQEIFDYYSEYEESHRLEKSAPGKLEFERTLDVLYRHLPRPPAVVMDVGGGPGVYAEWLLENTYEVHLIDPVERHVEQARDRLSDITLPTVYSINQGDARKLDRDDNSVDVVLLLGPLYHLTKEADRHQALAEAHRVLKPGGRIFAAAISRFASAMDLLFFHHMDEEKLSAIVLNDLETGQHRNPHATTDYFTTAYFHRPEELKSEVHSAGFSGVKLLALEGPAWTAPQLEEIMRTPLRRDLLRRILRTTEEEPSVIGASAHFLALGTK